MVQIFNCVTGYYEVKEEVNGTVQTNAATLVSGNLLDPAIVAAAGSLSAIAGAAAPYIALITVGGFLLYFALSIDSTKAEGDSKRPKGSDFEYYYAARKGNILLFSINNPIGIREAADFVRMFCTKTLPFYEKDAISLRNIYTPIKSDADASVSELENSPFSMIKCILDPAHEDMYFNIEYSWELNLKRINTHFFYGKPVSISGAAVA